jgi:hypothetical protein
LVLFPVTLSPACAAEDGFIQLFNGNDLNEVKDNGAKVAHDNVWFTEHIIVKGDHITIKVGALQGHDPGSTVYYKNIRIKPVD